ncbi:MAG: peptide deformylase [Candidatus Pacebacteria bacterium]|nr:peptide deformylase [Candidatus Paceibacterota bacterium]
MREIVQIGENEILRGKAKEVPIDQIKTPRVQAVLSDMKKALDSQDDGVAIAAPQIGVPLRIFIVSGKTYNLLHDDEKEYPHEVYINPEIINSSREKEQMEEGCLSVRGKYGKVTRPTKTTVKAYNEEGEEFTRGGSGLLSQIFQHETDHLDGVLFVDKATDIENL